MAEIPAINTPEFDTWLRKAWDAAKLGSHVSLYHFMLLLEDFPIESNAKGNFIIEDNINKKILVIMPRFF
jgi:hypothetical protein